MAPIMSTCSIGARDSLEKDGLLPLVAADVTFSGGYEQ